MKYWLAVFFILFINSATAQIAGVKFLSLPPEIADAENQVSGLYIAHQKLYLLSESRLQDSAPARLYSIPISAIENKINDTSVQLTYQIIPIVGLDKLRQRIDASGNKYEGLEAMVIEGDKIFLNVETHTPSPYCFILNGTFNGDKIIMNDDLLPLKKPRKENGMAIFNAGFEAMTKWKNKLYSFYEYNYFKKGSFVYTLKNNEQTFDSIPIQTLPFRITDITHKKGKKFTAINFFYKGDTMENGYVIDSTDKDYKLTRSGDKFISFIRLIEVKLGRKKIKWKPLLELPADIHQYNWEGITVYKNGYLFINDKYTPARPYKTTLAFIYKY